MKRREFISLVGGAAAAWPLAARAQQPGKRPLIVCLIGGSKASTERFFGGFSQGMRELGYVEGRDYGFEVRYAEGDVNRIPVLGRSASAQARGLSDRNDGRCTRRKEADRQYTDRLGGSH
jgi:putative ABC transport system substrate-binding protein